MMMMTLGPLPIISLICPELESVEILVRTLLSLLLGQDKHYQMLIQISRSGAVLVPNTYLHLSDTLIT